MDRMANASLMTDWVCIPAPCIHGINPRSLGMDPVYRSFPSSGQSDPRHGSAFLRWEPQGEVEWGGASLREIAPASPQGKARGCQFSPQGWQVHPRQLSDVGAFR